MYAPLSAYPKDGVPNETQTVLVSETSNAGSQDSFDPMPLKTSKSGAKVQDGFVIGFEDSNGFPTNKSTLVSRLAFPGTKNGKYDPKGEARHLTGIFYVTAAGSLKSLKPDDIAVTRLGKSSDLTGLWSTPIALNR